MLVYWQEVSVVVSCPKVLLHISLLWNSDGRLADQTNASNMTLWKKSPPSIPDGSIKLLVSNLVKLPHSFLYLSLGDKL